MADRRTLTVIIGAGASHDCAGSVTGEINEGFKPPLVKDLLEAKPAFDAILSKHPKARALSPTIRSRAAAGEGLEDVFRDLAAESSPFLRRQYWQIPLYLQELFGEVSTHFVRSGGTHFDRLVGEAERSAFDEILYITTNYDLFLEKVLADLYDAKFNTMEDYISQGRGRLLIKIQGSSTWGRKLQNAMVKSTNAVDIVDSVQDDGLQLATTIEVLKGYQDNARVMENNLFYPALAVPTSGKSDFVCPEAHLDLLQALVADCRNFLVVGFSALDAHVLKLLEPVKQMQRLLIVNGNSESGVEACGRIQAATRSSFVPEDVVFAGGFADFVRHGDFQSVFR